MLKNSLLSSKKILLTGHIVLASLLSYKQAYAQVLFAGFQDTLVFADDSLKARQLLMGLRKGHTNQELHALEYDLPACSEYDVLSPKDQIIYDSLLCTLQKKYSPNNPDDIEITYFDLKKRFFLALCNGEPLCVGDPVDQLYTRFYRNEQALKFDIQGDTWILWSEKRLAVGDFTKGTYSRFTCLDDTPGIYYSDNEIISANMHTGAFHTIKKIDGAFIKSIQQVQGGELLVFLYHSIDSTSCITLSVDGYPCDDNLDPVIAHLNYEDVIYEDDRLMCFLNPGLSDTSLLILNRQTLECLSLSRPFQGDFWITMVYGTFGDILYLECIKEGIGYLYKYDGKAYTNLGQTYHEGEPRSLCFIKQRGSLKAFYDKGKGLECLGSVAFHVDSVTTKYTNYHIDIEESYDEQMLNLYKIELDSGVFVVDKRTNMPVLSTVDVGGNTADYLVDSAYIAQLQSYGITQIKHFWSKKDIETIIRNRKELEAGLLDCLQNAVVAVYSPEDWNGAFFSDNTIHSLLQCQKRVLFFELDTVGYNGLVYSNVANIVNLLAQHDIGVSTMLIGSHGLKEGLAIKGSANLLYLREFGPQNPLLTKQSTAELFRNTKVIFKSCSSASLATTLAYNTTSIFHYNGASLRQSAFHSECAIGLKTPAYMKFIINAQGDIVAVMAPLGQLGVQK